MKWNLVLICLLLSWKTGFLARASADLLTLSSTTSTSLPRSSPSSLASQSACVDAVVAAMYSTSQLDKATTFCLTDCQQTKQLPRKNMVPLVLLLVSTSPAKSLSL